MTATCLYHAPVRATLVATALALVAAPVAAAPYYLKIDDIEGESQARGGKSHDKEIDIESVNWGTPRAPKAGKGGNVETEWKVEKGQKAAPRPGGRGSLASPGEAQAGLLLPAVQKVRGSMRGSYPGCTVGAHHDTVVATASDGRRIVLKDVVITSCSAAKVQFVHSKPH